MSLAINIVGAEGIVLAADSRQSYRNQKGMARIGSDSASKLFLINNRIGVAVTGLAFLQENGIPKSISKFIEQFKREVDCEKLSAREVADKLHYILDKKVKWREQLATARKQIEENFDKQGFEVIEIKEDQYRFRFKIKDKAGIIKDGLWQIEGLVLLVAGYNNADSSHESYDVYIPGEVIKRRDSKQQGIEYGANWIGQTDVVSRIIKGWDARIINIPFISEAIKQKGQQNIESELNGLEYAINWGAMPLQDAVDFAVLAIQTTSAIQRFSDGINADPGDIPGVGGPIDVLVLTPDGPRWIKQKELRIE